MTLSLVCSRGRRLRGIIISQSHSLGGVIALKKYGRKKENSTMDIFIFISKSSLELRMPSFETSSWSEADNILKKTDRYEKMETQCI